MKIRIPTITSVRENPKTEQDAPSKQPVHKGTAAEKFAKDPPYGCGSEQGDCQPGAPQRDWTHSGQVVKRQSGPMSLLAIRKSEKAYREEQSEDDYESDDAQHIRKHSQD